jgi:hypothetical protein
MVKHTIPFILQYINCCNLQAVFYIDKYQAAKIMRTDKQFKTKNTVLTDTILAFNNNVIAEVSHIKFLGLIIDDTLSWNLHIDKVMKI